MFQGTAVQFKYLLFLPIDINELIHNTALDSDEFVFGFLCKLNQRQLINIEMEKFIQCKGQTGFYSSRGG